MCNDSLSGHRRLEDRHRKPGWPRLASRGPLSSYIRTEADGHVQTLTQHGGAARTVHVEAYQCSMDPPNGVNGHREAWPQNAWPTSPSVVFLFFGAAPSWPIPLRRCTIRRAVQHQRDAPGWAPPASTRGAAAHRKVHQPAWRCMPGPGALPCGGACPDQALCHVVCTCMSGLPLGPTLSCMV